MPLLHLWQDYLTAIMVGPETRNFSSFGLPPAWHSQEIPCRMPLLWSDKAGCLGRRLAPRPLPAHLANAAML